MLNLKWNLIVVAVSSVGIDIISKYLTHFKSKTPILVLTKGLKLDKTKKLLLCLNSLIKLITN